MKKILVLMMVFGVLSVAAVSVSAQRATRITFARGTTSKVVTGTLSSYNSKRVYLIRVKAGQTMTVADTGNHAVSIWVEGPPGSGYEQDLAADCHGRTEISPTDAGDYKFTVQECSKVDEWRGTFKFKVTVR